MKLGCLLFASLRLFAQPVDFERNEGQSEAAVEFLSKGSGYALTLSSAEAVLFRGGREIGSMRLSGARAVMGTAEGPRPTISNYLIGADHSKWHTGVRHYSRIRYIGVYSGIDLVYYCNGTSLEYDFVVHPGADPNRIRLRFAGNIPKHKPLIYQEFEGRRVGVAGGLHHAASGQFTFEIAAFDHSRDLVIDPILAYSTYLGGSGEDRAFGIASDREGSVYVTGTSTSNNFPQSRTYQANSAGGGDVFVTKFDRVGNIVYSTYLGGSSFDLGTGIAVDATGSAYVVGTTGSSDFPTENALQPNYAGSNPNMQGGDAFIAKLSPSGDSLVYSTYLGGQDYDGANAIALDGVGNAYVTGSTFSSDFPTVHPLQALYAGRGDAFIAKVNTAGSALVYSTFLGGSAQDIPNAIAVDAAGSAYITGSTDGSIPLFAFPRTGGAFDVFVAKIDSQGSSLVYSRYLGGSSSDFGQGIAVDSKGSAWITGTTSSPDFPVLAPLQAKLTAFANPFLFKLTPSGESVLFSTFFGGTSGDYGNAIGVDAADNVYIAGQSRSPDFRVLNAVQPRRSAGAGTEFSEWDFFLTKIKGDGSAIVYSTYLGGSAFDAAHAIAVSARGDVYVTGESSSPDFPVVNSGQPKLRGGFNAVVTKVSRLTLAPTSLQFTFQGVSGDGISQTVTLLGDTDVTLVSVHSDVPWISVQIVGGSVKVVPITSELLRLPVGNLETRITVVTSEGDVLVIPVTAKLLPALIVSPPALTFLYNNEQLPPSSQIISIDSNVPRAAFSITSSAGWLSATPYSGNIPNSVLVSVSPAFLPAGNYTGTLTINAGSGLPRGTVTVTLKISSP